MEMNTGGRNTCQNHREDVFKRSSYSFCESVASAGEKHLHCQKYSPDTQACVQLVIQSLLYQVLIFSNPKDKKLFPGHEFYTPT